MVSDPPFVDVSMNTSNFTRVASRTRTPPPIYFSGLGMFTGDAGEMGKVESVSEETRNILGRKERKMKHRLKAGIYCTSGNASELESI